MSSAIATSSIGEAWAAALSTPSEPSPSLYESAVATNHTASLIGARLAGDTSATNQQVVEAVTNLRALDHTEVQLISTLRKCIGAHCASMVERSVNGITRPQDVKYAVQQLAGCMNAVCDVIQETAISKENQRADLVQSAKEVLREHLGLHLSSNQAATSCLSDTITRQFLHQCHYRDDGGLQGDQQDLATDIELAQLQGFASLIIDRAAKIALSQEVRRKIGPTTEQVLPVDCPLGAVHHPSQAGEQPTYFRSAALPGLRHFTMRILGPTVQCWRRDLVDVEGWQQRHLYMMQKLLLDSRSAQLFDLIADWPESAPAIEDLRDALQTIDARVTVSDDLAKSLRTRLLHPGARTQDILRMYVSMVYALRLVDPGGIILSRVAAPIRSYLRGRTDTVPAIVAGLLGDNTDFAELRTELQRGIEVNSAVATASDMSMLRTDGSIGDLSIEDDIPSHTAPSEQAWEPRPIDAGPTFLQTRAADVIAMLISIFEDRASFVKALEVTTARALLNTKAYDVSQEYRNNEILKRRFGEAALGKCDIMLQDAIDSRRIDRLIWQLLQGDPNARAADLERLPKGSELLKENSTLRALKPLITSRHFWPDLEGSEAAMATLTSGDGSAQRNVAATGIGPPPGGVNLQLPGSMGAALDYYNRCFSVVRESRRLRWLSGYGSVCIEIQMRDGRRWQEWVSPVAASILVAVSEEGVCTPENPLSKAALMDLCRAEEARHSSLLEEGLAFWVAKDVLVEVDGRPGWYVESFRPIL